MGFNFFQNRNIFFICQVADTDFAQNLADDSNMVILVFITVRESPVQRIQSVVSQLLDDGTISGRADNDIAIRHILGVFDAHQITIIIGRLHTCTGYTDQSISGFVVSVFLYKHILWRQVNESTAGAGSRWCGFQGNQVIRIEDVRFADKTIMGQIYYDYGEIDLIDDKGAVYRKRIRPGTILISKDNCSSAGVRNSTIVHECCHMYLDRWFFLLQIMAGRPYQAYSSRRKEHRQGIHRGTAIEWMEKQCEKLPAFLMMERDDTVCFVDRIMAEHGGVRSPESMRNMIELLAKRNGVSFSMAKCRMIELGYYEAEGIREYVNGQVIPDHGCAGTWPEKVTFTISAQDAAKLACADSAFESALRSGRYRYVEGHFCINDERYCYIDEFKRIRLTYYARNHIDECCLAFKVNGCRMKGEFRQSTVFRKKGETGQYPSGYTLAAEPGTEGYEKENSRLVSNSLLWMDVYKELEDEFGDAIKTILSRKNLTQETLAAMLGVSPKALYNYLNTDKISLPHVIGICVALSLPYYICPCLRGM